MDGLLATGFQLLAEIQKPTIIGAAICLAIGAYFFQYGGEQGRRNAKIWWIGAVIGTVVINGSYQLAVMLDNNITF